MTSAPIDPAAERISVAITGSTDEVRIDSTADEKPVGVGQQVVLCGALFVTHCLQPRTHPLDADDVDHGQGPASADQFGGVRESTMRGLRSFVNEDHRLSRSGHFLSLSKRMWIEANATTVPVYQAVDRRAANLTQVLRSACAS
jgi:hypothetical protein